MDKVLPYIILSIQEQNILFYNQKYCITKVKCFANTTQTAVSAAIAILSYILPISDISVSGRSDLSHQAFKYCTLNS